MNRKIRKSDIGIRTAVLLLLCLCLLFSGCRRRKENEKSSLGVDDGIGGFLFNFDQRAETASMVAAAKKKQLPGKVTWYYEPGSTSREGDKKVKNRTASSEDPELIETLYYALGNTIIVGIANNQSEFTHYFVSFDLGDDTQCRYDFVSENTVRLSGQNYVIETDGSLWRSLVMPEEAVTEGYEAEEAVTEGYEAEEAVTEGYEAEEAVTEGIEAEEAVTEGFEPEEAVTERIEAVNPVRKPIRI